VVAARTVAPSRASHFRFSAALACGMELAGEDLQDRPHLIPAHATTVAHLVGLPRPSPLPTIRSAFERHIFSVIARVRLSARRPTRTCTLSSRAAPSKSSPKRLMRRPAPLTQGPSGVTRWRTREARFASARRRASSGSPSGTSSTGRRGAPNAIELHPILGFACLSSWQAPL
jgi:hypothetical protein